MIRFLTIRIEDEHMAFVQQWSREVGVSQQELVYGILREAMSKRRAETDSAEETGINREELNRIVDFPVTRAEKLLSSVIRSYFELHGGSGEGTDHKSGD